MTGPNTLLLALQDAGALLAMSRLRPDFRTLALEREIPEIPLDGSLWCFVDWLLPDISGLEMVRHLRDARSTRHGHITMVLADDDPEDRRRALKAGADDYIVGPLTLDRLADRLDLYAAVEAGPPARARLQNGPFAIDLAAHQLRYGATPIPLRPNEFRLLVHFMEHPDQVFSRNALIEKVGKDDGAIDDRTVDVWVGRLRRSLAAHGAPDPLRTVRSLGYVMDSLGD